MIVHWDDEKDAIRPVLASEIDSFARRGFAERYRDWLRVMAEIVLPRVGTADQRIQDTAKRLIGELDQSGISVLLALPMLLYLDSDSYDEIVRRMRVGLVSTDEELVGGAAEGLHYWILRHASQEDICPPPEALLDELVNRALGRRHAGLKLVLARLRDIAKNVPRILSDQQIEELCLALEYLLSETSLPSHEDRNDQEQIAATIPVDQRPDHRAIAAQVAFQLARELRRRDAEAPQILAEWERASQSDPLPEVRRAWR